MTIDGISNKASERVFYKPPIGENLNIGSTSLIGRLRLGIVLKSPHYSWWHSPTAAIYDSSVKAMKNSFAVEEQILSILGEHPRIIK
jgi:hypothetical protein